MTDPQVIQSAYEAQLGRLWSVLLQRYADAAGNPADQSHADAAFQAGVQQARQVRDRALALL